MLFLGTAPAQLNPSQYPACPDQLPRPRLLLVPRCSTLETSLVVQWLRHELPMQEAWFDP